MPRLGVSLLANLFMLSGAFAAPEATPIDVSEFTRVAEQFRVDLADVEACLALSQKLKLDGLQQQCGNRQEVIVVAQDRALTERELQEGYVLPNPNTSVSFHRVTGLDGSGKSGTQQVLLEDRAVQIYFDQVNVPKSDYNLKKDENLPAVGIFLKINLE